MKLINKVLPILTITLVGTILTATSCTIAITPTPEPEPEGDVYEINEPREVGSGEFILQSNQYHIEIDTEMKFKVKWSSLKGIGASDDEDEWMIMAMNIVDIAKEEAYGAYLNEEKCHFFINDVEQKNGEIIVEDSNAILPTKKLNLEDDSVISGSIVVSKIIHILGDKQVEVSEAEMRMVASQGT